MSLAQSNTSQATPLTAYAPADSDDVALDSKLCSVLADTYRLMLNTQGIHWNGQGRAFFGLHKMTEEQYREMFEAVDEIAERIRALSYPAPQTFKAMLDLSEIEDIDAHAEMPEQLKQLARRHLELANRIKLIISNPEVSDDIGSVDLLTQRVRIHEKFSWLLLSVASS